MNFNARVADKLEIKKILSIQLWTRRPGEKDRVVITQFAGEFAVNQTRLCVYNIRNTLKYNPLIATTENSVQSYKSLRLTWLHFCRAIWRV